MRVFRLADPKDYRFARASRIGTWAPLDACECPQCGNSRQRRVPPLVIEWEPGSDVVGDFTWPGFDDEVVISGSVVNCLSTFRGFEAKPMEMHQNPELSSREGAPRVWLPYEGEALSDLWVTAWASLDLERTTATCSEKCNDCGYEVWDLQGHERREFVFDVNKMSLVERHSDRLPGAGLFALRASLHGADIFRIREFPAWIFITERVKILIDQQSFSNVAFLEMGKLSDQ